MPIRFWTNYSASHATSSSCKNLHRRLGSASVCWILAVVRGIPPRILLRWAYRRLVLIYLPK